MSFMKEVMFVLYNKRKQFLRMDRKKDLKKNVYFMLIGSELWQFF